MRPYFKSKKFFDETIYILFMVLLLIILIILSIYFLVTYLKTENLKLLILFVAFFGGFIIGLIEFIPILKKLFIRPFNNFFLRSFFL